MMRFWWRRYRFVWVFGLALAVLLGLGGAAPARMTSPAAPTSKSVLVAERNGDFTILPNGDVQVVETWVVVFHGGPFHYAFRSIPYDRLERVSDWRIAEGERIYFPGDEDEEAPYTFQVLETEEGSQVVWYFPETTDAIRTFTLRYTLHGVLWLDAEQGDRFFWTFVEADRGYPIKEATATIHLPALFRAQDLETQAFRTMATAEAAQTLDGRKVVFHASDLREGERWEIGVRWPHGAVKAAMPIWQMEAIKAARIENRTLDFQVLPNGRVLTTDTLQVRFRGGPFTYMEQIIAEAHLDGLSEWAVMRDGQPCAQASASEGCTWEIDYEPRWLDGYRVRVDFPPVYQQTQTFTLSYTQEGAVEQHAQGDLFVWSGKVPLDAPVDHLQIRVHLPQAFARGQVFVRGEVGWDEENPRPLVGTYQAETGTVQFEASDVPAGAPLRVQVKWPHGVVQAPLPQWQQRAIWRARMLVGGGALVFLFTLGGLAFVLGMWYWYGRDPAVGNVPKYLTNPPDDLPPGLVGVLLDEKVHTRDVLATFWDLARQGFFSLSVPLRADKPLAGTVTLKHRRPRRARASLRPHERKVLEAVFPHASEEEVITLRTAQQRLAAALDGIKEAMYADAVREGLFAALPHKVRGRMKKWAWLFVFLLVVFGGVVLPMAVPEDVSDVVVFFWGGALLVAMAAMWVAPRMPRKTRRGALEAAKWRAFRRYLLQLRRFVGEAGVEARDLFSLYLPYATAFGLARNLTAQFSRLEGARLPRWLEVVDTAAVAGESTAGEGALAASLPSTARSSRRSAGAAALNQTSEAVFAHLSRIADDLFDTLNVATGGSGGSSSSHSSWGSSYSSFGGGSWSSGGGGFSSGGSSGGGSSGFG